MTRKIDPKTHKFVRSDKPLQRKITAHFDDEEALQIASYAQNYGLTTSEFVRRSMLEKIAHVPMLGGK